MSEKSLSNTNISVRNNGTFRWTPDKDCAVMKEIRVVEPYLHRSGSKLAGQKWKDVADNLNVLEGFKKNPRDQRSVREHFQKLVEAFKSKMRIEETASGISPPPLTEAEQILEEVIEIMKNKVDVEEKEDSKMKNERAKALAIRTKAMNTWSAKGKSAKNQLSDDDDDDDDDESDKDADMPTPTKVRKKRRRTSEAFKFLEDKAEKEAEVRKEEISYKREMAALEANRQDLLQQQIQMQQQQMQQMQTMMLAVVSKLTQDNK